MAEPSIEEILKAIEKASKDNPAAFKRLQTALQVKTQEEEIDLGAKAETVRKNLQLQLDRNKALEKAAKLNNDLKAAQEAKNKALEYELRLELDRQGFAKEDINLAIERVKLGEESGLIIEEGLEHLNEMLSVFQQHNEELENRKRIQADINKGVRDTVDSMASLVGLEDKYSKSRIKGMTTLFTIIKEGGPNAKGAISDLVMSFKNMFNAQNIAMNVGSAIFKQSMETLKSYDKAIANLAKTTGTVGKFNDVLYDAQRAGNLLGVTMENVGTAITALNAGTTEFAKLNEQTQTQLAIATSQFEKLGVSSQDTAAFMENAFKIMNMGATEAIKVQKELAMAGVDLGIGADKIVKDFNAASKTLAVYGKGSVKIFKDLAAQAKAAGVEVSTLLGIVQKFDTFSGAAEGAAHFNALLGTQLSTTEMLMMTEDERMKTLVEQVQAQGVAFGDMDRYTQKAIAAAAGISDMNEANRIFSMSLADYEANAAQMEENAAAQAKFDEAVQATVPTMNKFKNLATELITLVQPALETLGDIADYLTDVFQNMSKETKQMLSGLALFLSGIVVLAPLLAVGGGLMTGLAALGPAIAGIGAGIATAVGAISAITMTGVGAGVLGTLIAAGGGIAATMSSIASSKAAMAESNAKMMSEGSETIQSMAEIGRADFSGIAVKFKGVVDELNSMSTDVKVTSMMQNLSLISAGTAIDITGAKIQGSATNVTANVQNFFDGMHMVLEAGGEKFDAYVRTVAAETTMA